MKKPTYFKTTLFVLFLVIHCLSGFAQTYLPFSVRENIEVKGSMLVIGNNILGVDNLPGNDNSIDNQDVFMQYIDIDGDASTFSSSSADLVLSPHEDGSETACYRVAYAALYWGAILQNGSRANINQVKFKTPESSTYTDLTGQIVYDAIVNPIPAEPSEPNNTPYACYAEVTHLLSDLTDIEGTYTVANITSSEGMNFSTGLAAGWTLFVIYEDPELHTKSFTTFDGFSHIYDDHYEEIPVTGFTTPPGGHIDLQFAYATLDGDKNNRATKLEINGKEVTTPLRPANKFFGAVIENTNGVTHPRNPFGTNTLGYDTGFLEILNSEPEYIGNNDTSASFVLQVARGQADPIFSFFSAFAVDVIGPEVTLTKLVTDDNGNEINGDDVYLGQNLFYEIYYQNTGNDDITNFTITDVLPDNIVFDPATDIDLSNAGGATLQSYDPVTQTLVFSIPDGSVEVGDPEFVIRLAVQVVPNCYDLSQACSNEIINQAFGSYTGVNSGIVVDEQASYNSDECFITPQPTNFLVDISDCNFEREEVLCGDSVILTAADGYDAYSWSTSPTGTPVIGTGQTFTATEVGTYYVTNTAPATCLSIQEVIHVVLYGTTQTNPVIPYADEVVICPNDGKPLPNIFLCGANDTRDILTGISDAVSIIWEQLDESSCPAVTDPDCANENDACTWNQVGSGPDYTANTAGQFRLIINYPGGCYSIFYFNVYQNLLDPDAVAQDILCDTPGQITVLNVPSGYEYSLDGVNYQTSNIFTVTTPGYYIVYIRQIGVDTNPCIFETPSVYVRARDFSVTTNITQPECYGDMGSVHMAVNDALPQYYFSVHQNGTLIDSVGPTTASDYTFNSLNAGTYTITASTDDGCLYTEDITITEPPLLTVTAALTQPLTCTDGEITIYPEGGTPPYVYDINGTDFQTSPVIIVETAGTYVITVQDANNCTAETTIIVEAVPEPDFTVTQTNIACADNENGTITINVTNANGNTLLYSIDGGVTFTNSPVFTNLPEGTYTVVVQYSLGTSVCETDPQTVTITAAPPLDGTAQLTAPYTCTNSGTITVTGVTGGTPPYSYSLDGINFQTGNTFTGLSAGTYTVTIQDASGCAFIANTIVIDALNPPTDITLSHTPLSCPTNVSTVTITGVTGGTGVIEYQIIAPASAATPYQSSNVFTGLAPGTYTFQVRDENDCTYAETYTIDPLPELNLNTVLNSDLDCSPSSQAEISGTISGGVPPYSYGVSINGGAYTNLGATGGTFTYTTTTAGTYQFQVVDANNCSITSIVHTVEPVTPPALSLVAQTEPILCHGDANAAIDITIDSSVGTPPFTINVYNDTTGTDYGSQTSGLTAGSYTITITDAKSCTATDTIVIAEPDAINVNYHTVDITCTPSGVSQGSIIIDSVTGGTAPYNYYVTGTNGYSNSEFNASGSTSVSFDVVDFGLYEINVIDANGCSVLVQDVLVASPPTDLDISITATVDCATGGEAVVSIGSSLSSSGPFYFSIYQGPVSVYPNPPGSWIPEDAPGSESATFTGLTPGVSYTFIVYDASTNCSYFEPATAPIPTNSTLTATAVTENNISCTGSADGNVSFNINSIYATSVDVQYEIFESLSQASTGITGNGTVPANGTLAVNNLGPLPFGNYYVLIEEINGPNAGCSIVTVPFNITESMIPLTLTVAVDQNANCNPNSGIISAIGHDGTAPYQYQITTTATAPTTTDPAWASNSVFNVDGGTYYVHVMDAYGCIVSSPVTMPTDPSPVIDAAVTNQCTVNEGEFEIEVTMPTAGVPPYSFSINGGAFQTQTVPFTLTNLSSGTHTIEVADANGCGNLVSVTIEAPLGLTPDLTAAPSCNNDDGVITVTGTGGSGNYSYTISPNPASVSITGNTITGVPSGIYTITITDTVTLCTAEATISLPEAILPTLTTTPTAVSCFGDNSGAFELFVNGYSGAYTYEVFNDTGVSVMGPIAANTTTNPEIVTGLAAGSYTVTITETAVPFCSATSSVVISSPTGPLTLTALETANVTCNNDSGTITATATGGWGNYEYELTGDAYVGYSPNGTFTGLSAGNYTVNVRDDSNCIASVNVTLAEPNPITATFTPSTTLLPCFGDQNASITVSNVTGGQGSNYTYTLNTILPTPSSSGPQTSNVFNNLGAGTYSVTITDGYNCETTSANIVIDEPTPVDVNLVTATTQTCLNGATLTLSASGGTPPYTYSDNANFTTVLGSFNTTVTFSVTDGTHSYYVQDANGCTTNASNTITVEPLQPLVLNLDSTNPTINCAGDNTGNIVASAQGGLGNYVYTLQDTLGNTINATQDTPGVFTELFAGSYVVYVESGDCNTTSQTITITEPSTTLNATFVVDDVTCTGSNDGRLEINATGGTGIIMYAISPNLNQFFETNVFENLAPGTYDVIVQDQLGCFLTHTFTVTEPTPVILNIVPNSIFPEVCEGDLDGEFSINLSGGSLPYSVSLDNYNGPYTTGAANQTQFDFTGLSGGDHTVFVRDAEGCESEWNITMPESVNMSPTLLVEYGCVNNISSNTVTVFIDESVDASQVEYALNGGTYQASNTFIDVPAGMNHYIEVRHTNGCIQATEFFSIDAFDPLTLVLTEGELNQIVAHAAGGSGDYEFTFNGENYGSENTYFISASGTHTVMVTDSYGCTAVAVIEMEFVDVCIPNYFTPNGDGTLDEWGPGCALNYPDLEFSIFDRYGRKIATLRVGEKWDGTYKGNELPTGDYWYVVNFRSSNVDRNIVGHFTLYR